MAFNIREIFAALDANHVDYVVVGGFAVIMHGYLRATADLDLVVGLSDENARTQSTHSHPSACGPGCP